MNEIPVLFKKKKECSGCSACFAICPKQAINMVEDEEGFFYPNVKADQCIRCYLCIKVCPMKGINKEEK